MGADLLDYESVKDTLTLYDDELDLNTKACIIGVYTSFARYYGFQWKPPIYKCQNRIPFTPEESEFDSLIAGCNRQIVAYFKRLKKQLRYREAARLAHS